MPGLADSDTEHALARGPEETSGGSGGVLDGFLFFSYTVATSKALRVTIHPPISASSVNRVTFVVFHPRSPHLES
jgi:hypothetical protein